MKLLSGHIGGLLTFTGRENREPFWLWILITYVARLILGTIASIPVFLWLGRRIGNAMSSGHTAALKDQQAMFRDMAPMMSWMAVIGLVLGIAYIAVVAAAVVRRLHDGDRSGWWIVPVALLEIASMVSSMAMVAHRKLIPVAGKPFAVTAQAFGPIQFVSLLALVALVVVLVLPGTDGPNRFGPDPLGR